MKTFLAALMCVCLCAPVTMAAVSSSERGITFDPGSIHDQMGEAWEDKSTDETLAVGFIPVAQQIAFFKQDMTHDAADYLEDFANIADTFAPLTASTIGQAVPTIWEYFFGTSVVLIGHTRNAVPMAAYYNPFLDAAMYVQWETYDGGAMPVAMVMDVFGAPGADGALLPRWIVNGGRPLAFWGGYQAFLQDFETTYPPGSAAPSGLPRVDDLQGNVDLVAARSLTALVGLTSVMGDGSDAVAKRTWGLFHRALETGDRSALLEMLPEKNQMGLQEILEIPQPMRMQLDPVYVLVGKDVSMVYQQVASAPTFVGVAGVSNEADITAQDAMQSFVFFSLDARATQDRSGQ